ncbi:GntR family transcriptional regulator [Amycolatopsis thermoflava]
MALHVTERIASGELAPDTPLPAERRLACEYGVSLGSARHATYLLHSRGFVVTIRSKGTYIARDAQQKAEQRLQTA